MLDIHEFVPLAVKRENHPHDNRGVVASMAVEMLAPKPPMVSRGSSNALSSLVCGYCARLALTFTKINQIYVFCTYETYIDYLCILYIYIKSTYVFHLYIIFSYRYRMYM